MSSRSLRTPEREPTSYHFSSLWAELEALLESVLLLDWLDEYGASGYSEMRTQISIFTVFYSIYFIFSPIMILQAHSTVIVIIKDCAQCRLVYTCCSSYSKTHDDYRQLNSSLLVYWSGNDLQDGAC